MSAGLSVNPFVHQGYTLLRICPVAHVAWADLGHMSIPLLHAKVTQNFRWLLTRACKIISLRESVWLDAALQPFGSFVTIRSRILVCTS